MVNTMKKLFKSAFIQNINLQVIELKTVIVIMLLIANIPLYRYIFRFIFRDSKDFRDSVNYSFTPDFISLFKGEYRKDKIGEIKLFFFILACVIPIMVEYSIIKTLINIFSR